MTSTAPDAAAGSVPDGYTIADMAAEVAALLEELGVARCHFIGHALGGLIGLQLAVDRPALLDRLVVVNAWAKTHPHTLRCFAIRKQPAAGHGTRQHMCGRSRFFSILRDGWPTGRNGCSNRIRRASRIFRQPRLCCGASRRSRHST